MVLAMVLAMVLVLAMIAGLVVMAMVHGSKTLSRGQLVVKSTPRPAPPYVLVLPLSLRSCVFWSRCTHTRSSPQVGCRRRVCGFG